MMELETIGRITLLIGITAMSIGIGISFGWIVVLIVWGWLLSMLGLVMFR